MSAHIVSASAPIKVEAPAPARTDLHLLNSIELAAFIRSAIEDCRTHLSNALGAAMDAGDALAAVKPKVNAARPRMPWKLWLELNCPIAKSTAELYMQLAEHRAEIEAAIRGNQIDSSIRAARKLISVSRDRGVDDDAGDTEPPPPSSSADPVAAAVDTINALAPTQLRDCLGRVTDIHKRAIKQHYTGGRSEAAVMVEIADLADAIIGRLERPDDQHPEKDRTALFTRLARIKELTGRGGKSDRKTPVRTNARLDRGAFARGMGTASLSGEKFPTMTMTQDGVDASGNPVFG